MYFIMNQTCDIIYLCDLSVCNEYTAVSLNTGGGQNFFITFVIGQTSHLSEKKNVV